MRKRIKERSVSIPMDADTHRIIKALADRHSRAFCREASRMLREAANARADNAEVDA
jgi:hypothetical protein